MGLSAGPAPVPGLGRSVRAGAAAAGHDPAVAYKRMPSDVIAPIMQMLDWLLWSVLLLCLAWLIVSAGRLWLARGAVESDAAHGVLMSLIGALVASTATGIALALLPA